MFELTPAQRQPLAESEPVAIDPTTHEQYILVRNDVYEKTRGLLEDDARTMYPLLADLDPADWEDPSVYENS